MQNMEEILKSDKLVKITSGFIRSNRLTIRTTVIFEKKMLEKQEIFCMVYTHRSVSHYLTKRI